MEVQSEDGKHTPVTHLTIFELVILSHVLPGLPPPPLIFFVVDNWT